MSKKNQSGRLTDQHKESQGVVGIFGNEAKLHDSEVARVAYSILKVLEDEFPQLNFRFRQGVSKAEINASMQKIDRELGQTLFVSNSAIKPDGGLIEVMDDEEKWRIILVSEAKHQGKDIENLRAGKLVGKGDDQDLMVAGNAIERAHKNICEIANLMMGECYFPYVLFLEGSNFLTQDVVITRPNGSNYTLIYNLGSLNRLDRLTAANYGMPINTNLCKNKFIVINNLLIMLQAASIYTQGDGNAWAESEMRDIMLDIAKTALQMLGRDLFQQLTNQSNKADD